MTEITLGIVLKGDASGLVGEVKLSNKELDKLGRSAKDAGKDAARGGRGVDRFGKDAKKAGSEARRLNKESKKLGRGFQEAERRARLLRLAVVALATGMTARLVSSFVQAASTTEQYRLRLVRLLRDTEEANRLFDDMADFAARVPFEFEEIMGSATQLAGVLRGGREEVARFMPLIADLAAVTGISIQDTTGQVIRMFSAGAASADLFRERGVLAMLGFQAGVSVSAEETRRRMIEAWESPTSQFRDTTRDLARTWVGLTSMMSDKWFQFRNQVMDAGPFDFLKASFAVINQEYDTNASEMEERARALGDELVEGFKATMLGTAAVIDTVAPIATTAASVIGAMIQQFNDLPPWLQEIGIMGALLGGKKIRLLFAAILLWKEAGDRLQELLPLPGEITLGEQPEKTILGDLLTGSLFGRPDGEDAMVARVERFLARVEAQIEASRNRVKKSGGFGTGDGDGTGDPKAEGVFAGLQRTNDELAKLRFAQLAGGDAVAKANQEIAVQRALYKSGAEAGSVLAFQIRELARENFRLKVAIGDGDEALRRHEKTVEDIAAQMIALKSPFEQAIAAADIWRKEALAGLDAAKAGYDEFGANIQRVYNGMIAEAFEQSLADSRRWEDGVTRGLDRVIDVAGDTATQVEDALTGAFDNMEDAIVAFRKSGEFNFSKFADSVIDDLIRISIRASITEPFANFLSGLDFGTLFASGPGPGAGPPIRAHAGGILGRDAFPSARAPAAAFANAPRFGGGGMVGGERLVIAHDEEGIFTPRQMDNADAILRAALSTGGTTVQIIDQRGQGAPVQASRGRGPDGRETIRLLIRDEVTGGIQRGDFDQSLGSRFGVAPGLAVR